MSYKIISSSHQSGVSRICQMLRRVGDVLRTRVEDLGQDKELLKKALQDSPAHSQLHAAIPMIPPLPFMTGPDRHQESQRGPGGLCCRFLESFLSQIFDNSWTKGPAWNGEGVPPVT